jgi:glycosyltransferase involved in cell wall biosynthesis
MIILTVHNSYKELGGEDVVFEAESRVLEDHGHTVYRYHEDNSSITCGNRIVAGLSAVWSHRAYRRMKRVIQETGCDVVHFHNIFPLISPAAYYAAQESGVPVVQTLHNYRALCPNALLFRRGRICEECVGASVPWRGVLNGCYRQSRLSTASVALMLAFHRLLKTWDRAVDLYIAPSRVCREKYIQAGFDPQRIEVKPGFVYPDPGVGRHGGDYFLFVGRLSEEKGLDVLFDAWRSLGASYPLKVVGDGPLAPLAMTAAREMPWVEWLGYRSSQEVLDLMGDARALVFPCQAYATFGLVVVEAFAKGTPAIVSGQGALAELVRHGGNGLHFDSRSPAALAAAVRSGLGNAEDLARLRRNARADFLSAYTASANADALVRLYQRVIGGRKGESGSTRRDAASRVPAERVGRV